jgi:predicted RNA-binding protein with RPS1 domain
MANAAAPDINTLYRGKVIGIESLGFKVQLINFRKKFVGLIHSHLLEGTQMQDRLHHGTTVNVKVISVDNQRGFMTISLIDIVSDDETLLPRSKTINGDGNRVIRISSPERYQVKQMTSTYDNVIMTATKEPQYYAMQQLCLELGSFGLFSSVTEMPKGFMLSNAIRMKTQPFTNFKEFIRYHKNFHDYWVQGEYMNDKSPARCNPALADSASQLWNSKKRNAMQIKKQRELLPIYSVREDLIRAVTNNRILIVQGETGSGLKIN